MKPTIAYTFAAALRRAWAGLHLHARAQGARRRAAQAGAHDQAAHADASRCLLGRRPRVLRRCAVGLAVLAGIVAIPIVALSWRLANGPLSLDLVTPWLSSAVEDRFGGRHRIEVGGTQLERTEEGGTAIRMRDIVVRDPDGTEVARAPKAEVGLSGFRLLTGRVQAERLSLIGVTMAVRIEPDGEVSISAGAKRQSIGTAPAIAASAAAVRSSTAPSADGAAAGPGMVASALAWLADLDALGLDGKALTEIGLKNGSLVVDDRRGGKQWRFDKINLSVTRPKEGGVAFALNSVGADGPWSLTATVTPHGEGRRAIEAVIRDVSPNDLLLALRIGNGRLRADMPVSGILRAEIEPDGAPLSAEGRILVKSGYFLDPDNREGRVVIDEGQVSFKWDAEKRLFVVPIELLSSGNRFAWLGQVEAPHEPGGAWGLEINRGLVSLAPDQPRETPLVLDRFSIRGRFDSAKRRIEIDQGDASGAATGVSFSGALDWSSGEPRISGGLATTKLTASGMKRLWPIFIQSKIRLWVVEHLLGGTADRVLMAVNAPLAVLKPGGPAAAEDAISIDISGSGAVVRPIDGLPPFHDADMVLRATGRTVTIRMGRGTADMPSGKKLALSSGVFEVTDTHVQPPPARVRFKMEGPADAAAELVAMEPLRDPSGAVLDPATVHGTISGQVTAAWPIMDQIPKEEIAYTVEADLANFAADRMARGQKVEGTAPFHLSANQQGVQAKGDFRVGGVPAYVEFRRASGAAATELRATTTLDEKAFAKLGFDWNGALAGPIPVKLNGRVGAAERDGRFAIEADVTPARVAEFLPGWSKAAGTAARATFVMQEKPQGMRFEDIVVEGSGTLIKGAAEIDADGEVVNASFPTYAPSDGDKASLKAERTPDGIVRVTMRGEVFQGRNFIRGAIGGPTGDKPKHATRDYDLDIKIGAVAGFNGETVRSLELGLAKRGGQVRNFGLTARIGRDATPLIGDLRAYRDRRQVIYVETNDGGALMRFVDIYSKMLGGALWLAMDPPSTTSTSQNGLINVRDFTVRGEPLFEKVAATGPIEPGTRGLASSGVQFTQLRLEFLRSPGRLSIRDGRVIGPSVGVLLDGHFDYARNEMSFHGNFVPAYAVNNIIPRILPFVAPQNEGLFGVTFEVVGPMSEPTLRVQPLSAVAPGFLRKLFEYQGNAVDQNYAPAR
jgi:hypothetical protein